MSSQEIIDVKEIERAIARFFLHLDLGEYRELSNMMADDGVWERQGKELRGPAMTMAAMQERPEGRTTLNVVTNFVVDVSGPDAASASFYMVAWRHDGDTRPQGAVPMELPRSAQIFRAKLGKVKGKWRIRHMFGTPVLSR